MRSSGSALDMSKAGLDKADYREALKWLRRAAEHGEQNAQNSLGVMYEEGEGVPQSDVLAAKWYRKRQSTFAICGAGSGRNNLGLLYLDGGRGVPKDDCSSLYVVPLSGRGQ